MWAVPFEQTRDNQQKLNPGGNSDEVPVIIDLHGIQVKAVFPRRVEPGIGVTQRNIERVCGGRFHVAIDMRLPVNVKSA